MTDYETIQNLKAHYCRAVDGFPDDRDAAHADLSTLLVDDVVADYGFGDISGKIAVVDFLAEQIAGGSIWILHNVHSPLITLADGHAFGEWTVNARMKRSQTGAVDTVSGRYSDEFSFRSGEWKVTRIRFHRYE